MKTYRNIFLFVITVAFVCVTISLFLPYLVKLNIRSGDLTLPKQYVGYDYTLAVIILVILLSTLLTTWIDQYIAGMILSCFVLFFTWVVRFFIHFQGAIDHDYDSKTGVGFLLLFIASIIHFIISLIALLIKTMSKNNQNFENNDILDQYKF